MPEPLISWPWNHYPYTVVDLYARDEVLTRLPRDQVVSLVAPVVQEASSVSDIEAGLLPLEVPNEIEFQVISKPDHEYIDHVSVGVFLPGGRPKP